MIDFRYHLVSLVSVFLALAIGVVLGAGPLRESIGDTLGNQVEALQRDKENLQLAVANREEEIQQRDAFISSVAEDLVAEQLGGRGVVLVTLPGTQGQALDELQTRLEEAGATVTGRVNLLPSWVSADDAATREEVLASLPAVPAPNPAGSPDEDPTDAATGTATDGPAAEPTRGAATGGDTAEVPASLADALAGAVVTADVGSAGQPDATAAETLQVLRDADLVTVDGDPAGSRASLAVVLAPSAEDTVPDGEDVEAAVAAWVAVAESLDAAGSGALVAGAAPAAAEGGVVFAVRTGDDVAQEVSTVDGVDTPLGRVAAVLALREQLAGDVGHYGFAEGADAPLPAQ